MVKIKPGKTAIASTMGNYFDSIGIMGNSSMGNYMRKFYSFKKNMDE